MQFKKIKILLEFLGRDAIRWLILGAMGSLVLSSIELFLSGLMQLLFYKIDLIRDVFLPESMNFLKAQSLFSLCLLFGLIGGVRAILTLLTSQSGNIFSNIINTRLRMISIYDLLIVKRTRVLPASEINLRFSDIYPKTATFVANASSALIVFVQSICLFFALAYIGFKETIVGLIGVFVIGVSLKFIRGHILNYSKKVLNEQEEINKSILRVTQNWINIKILRTQNEEYIGLIDRLLTYFNHSSRSGLLLKLSGVLPSFLGSVLLATIIYMSNTVFHSNSASMLPFLYLFLRFVQSISTVTDSYFSSLSNFPYFQRAYRDFVNVQMENIQYSLKPESGMKMFSIFEKGDWNYNVSPLQDTNRGIHAPSIKIENMDYRWNADGDFIFNNLNLSINSNSIFGIIGPSGRGKSTLLLLILGIIKPEKGNISIDSKSADEYLNFNAADIGYVGPDAFLIAGTIKENLLYGQTNKNLNDDDLKSALNSVHLESLINKLEYKISENAEGLSSGQKQRLSLARTLLRKPKLIILDEASANLDAQTEENIAELINSFKKDSTIIIVTHRPAMIKYADSVLNLGE